MTMIYYIIPILILLYIINDYRITILTLKTQNKLLALQNEMFAFRTNDNVAYFNSIYEKINSIRPVIKHLNILYVLFFMFSNYKLDGLKKGIKKFAEEENNKLQDIYNRHINVSVKYLMKKSLFTSLILFIIFMFFLAALLIMGFSLVKVKAIKNMWVHRFAGAMALGDPYSSSGLKVSYI